ncbi:hypothetical protein PIB30_020209 [Stylosanthes scabra]|uniref:Uncharacterized protein n=1 Tax=Stylosanthes scabra TaxID=79078 RepID=A0ABU6S9U6_9FABA|nr:hypothetical protein [Stylosanthes scabra]
MIFHKVSLCEWNPVAVSRGALMVSHLMACGMNVNFQKSKAICSNSISNSRREVFSEVSSIRLLIALTPYDRLCDFLPFVHIFELDFTISDIWHNGYWHWENMATPILVDILNKPLELNPDSSVNHPKLGLEQ